VGCFGGHGMLKASQQPGGPKEIPCEGSSRNPPGEGACGDREQSVSRLASRHRAAILNDIIICVKT